MFLEKSETIFPFFHSKTGALVACLLKRIEIHIIRAGTLEVPMSELNYSEGS